MLCANMALHQEQHALAATFLGAADASDAEKALPTQPIERDRRIPVEQAVREHLCEREYAEAIARGSALGSEQVLSAATDLLDAHIHAR